MKHTPFIRLRKIIIAMPHPLSEDNVFGKPVVHLLPQISLCLATVYGFLVTPGFPAVVILLNEYLTHCASPFTNFGGVAPRILRFTMGVLNL
jgi:hypothetical protein